jgi:hypothetical protein
MRIAACKFFEEAHVLSCAEIWQKISEPTSSRDIVNGGREVLRLNTKSISLLINNIIRYYYILYKFPYVRHRAMKSYGNVKVMLCAVSTSMAI